MLCGICWSTYVQFHFYLKSTTCSWLMPMTHIPEIGAESRCQKIGTKLHIRCSRNRYRFGVDFWCVCHLHKAQRTSSQCDWAIMPEHCTVQFWQWCMVFIVVSPFSTNLLWTRESRYCVDYSVCQWRSWVSHYAWMSRMHCIVYYALSIMHWCAGTGDPACWFT